MSGFDATGATQIKIIQALENRIAALESQVRTRLGAPVTRTSGALFIPNVSEPSPQSGGVKVYAVSGGLRVIEPDGTVHEVGGGVQPAEDAPTYPASFTSPATIGGTPTASNYNDLRADVVNQLFNPLRGLIQIGRDAGFWPSS
ncbi:hypothetical protein AB0I81_40270 [Nonomuraea sp. NPDC050404]|uniref:hypothetical protein n=1 Tax=Nonomuraea sp. NPDC050404 TaxID=3155783 RepID=UPI0033C0AF8C